MCLLRLDFTNKAKHASHFGLGTARPQKSLRDWANTTDGKKAGLVLCFSPSLLSVVRARMAHVSRTKMLLKDETWLGDFGVL
jgi:hypothetical protein